MVPGAQICQACSWLLGNQAPMRPRRSHNEKAKRLAKFVWPLGGGHSARIQQAVLCPIGAGGPRGRGVSTRMLCSRSNAVNERQGHAVPTQVNRAGPKEHNAKADGGTKRFSASQSCRPYVAGMRPLSNCAAPYAFLEIHDPLRRLLSFFLPWL